MIQWTRPKTKACRKFPLFSASSYFFKEWFPSSCLKYHNSIILRLKLLHVFAFLHGTMSFKVAPALGALLQELIPNRFHVSNDFHFSALNLQDTIKTICIGNVHHR